ncbi:MAG: GntR family transcriptional regulator [Hyphomicrobiaceae bacterium]
MKGLHVGADRFASPGTPVAGGERLRGAEARIIAGKLAAGAQLLEEELAVMLGMSRTPLREAAVRLEQEGFVEIVPRRGIRVGLLTKRSVREVNEVLECLEIQAAQRLAGRRVPAEDLRALEAAVAAMDRALEGEDITAWADADYAFHSLVITLCGNQHLADTARTYLDKAHRFRLLTLPLRPRPCTPTSITPLSWRPCAVTTRRLPRIFTVPTSAAGRVS